MGQEHGSRESSGVIKAAPDEPSVRHMGAQDTLPVPEPAHERSSGSQVSDYCASADKEAKSSDNQLIPAPEGRVIGRGRLHFHTAPKAECRDRNRFIIPGNAVVVHRRHGKWLLIDYVSRDGVTHSAWVDAARIDWAKPVRKP